MSDNSITKRCNKCGEIKSMSLFYRSKTSTDGRRSQCKLCEYFIKKKYRQTEQGKTLHASHNRKYSQTEKGQTNRIKGKTKYRNNPINREIEQVRNREYKAQNPQKIKAQATVQNKVKRGRFPQINTLACECGNQAQVYHHDKGYEEQHWLDVIPVCKPCHAKLHNQCVPLSVQE